MAPTDAHVAPSGTGGSGGSFTRLSGIIHSGNVRGALNYAPGTGLRRSPWARDLWTTCGAGCGFRTTPLGRLPGHCLPRPAPEGCLETVRR